jgi:hypothetical protein
MGDTKHTGTLYLKPVSSSHSTTASNLGILCYLNANLRIQHRMDTATCSDPGVVCDTLELLMVQHNAGAQRPHALQSDSMPRMHIARLGRSCTTAALSPVHGVWPLCRVLKVIHSQPQQHAQTLQHCLYTGQALVQVHRFHCQATVLVSRRSMRGRF